MNHKEDCIPDFCIDHVEEIVNLKSRVTILETSFPDGPANHRRAHEEMIAAAVADKAFVRELKLDASKKGLWFLLILLLGLLVIGAEIKIKTWLGIGGH